LRIALAWWAPPLRRCASYLAKQGKRKEQKGMAKPNGDESQPGTDNLTAFESKIVNLLALLLVQERKLTDQVSLLSRAGFSPAEIAALLGTTPNMVSVLIYQQKKEKRKTARRKQA
jgi:hypothetical protein